jgi:hypothetical protein
MEKEIFKLMELAIDLGAERDEARADSAHQAEIIARLGDEVDGLRAKLDRVMAWRNSDGPLAFRGRGFRVFGGTSLDQAFDDLDEILGNNQNEGEKK